MIQSTKTRIIAVSKLLMLARTSAALARDTGIPIVWYPVAVTTGILAGSTGEAWGDKQGSKGSRIPGRKYFHMMRVFLLQC